MTLILQVDAVDLLLFRDARPFSASNDETRATSLPLPSPSTIGGLVRAVLARWDGLDPSVPSVIDQLSSIRVRRYWFELGGEVMLSAPADCVVLGPDTPHARRLRPTTYSDEAACNLPPGMLPVDIGGAPEGKPLAGYRLWSFEDVCAWRHGAPVVPRDIPYPDTEERVQLQADPDRHTAAAGKLFTTQYRTWEHRDDQSGQRQRWRLLVEVDGELEGKALAPSGRRFAHFGGERRPVSVSVVEKSFPDPPEQLVQEVIGATRLTMQLATPGLFGGGWRPAWLDNPGSIDPALDNLTLVSACVGRPRCISGWSLDPRSFGPKATYWAAPEGSVYFFELSTPLDEQALHRLWGRCLSDRQDDIDNGFGMTLWGVWD